MKISVKLPNGKLETHSSYQAMVTIGRSNKNDFPILDEALSRHHCQIEIINGEFFVTDLGSSNGVFLDGQRIAANQRTPITTFLQLTLGPLECVVTDGEEQMVVSQNKKPKATVPSQTTQTTQIISKSKSGSKLNFKFIASILVVVGIGFYQYQSLNKQAPPSAPAAVELSKNVPEAFKTIKDSLLSESDYEVMEASKSCEDPTNFCQELKLSLKDGEGIVEKDKEFFVYLNPQLHEATFPRSTKLKESPDYLEIVSLFTLLNSSLFEQFQMKKIAQIHLLIKNDKFKTTKVYRFHTKTYASNERVRMLTEIGQALNTGDTKAFWKYSSPLFETHTF